MKRLLFFAALLFSFESNAQSPCVSVAVNGSPCAPASFQLFACTADATDAEWSFPGSTNPNQTGLFVTSVYEAAGVYNVSVTMDVPGGTVDTSFNITVSDAPDICIASPSPSGCTGQTLCFDATCTAGIGLTYEWSFDDSTTAQLGNTCHDFTEEGCQDVQLTITDSFGCESDTLLENFACVNPSLVACFTSLNNPCNCSVPYTVQLQSCSTPSGGITYEWITPGDSISLSPNASATDVIYTEVGFYDVTLIVINSSNCSDTVTIPDYVCISDFTPTFAIQDTTYYTDVPIVIQGGPATSWSWTITPSTVDTIDNDQIIIATFNQPGTYEVCLNATFNGCSAQLCSTLVITSPTAVVDFENSQAKIFYSATSKQIVIDLVANYDATNFLLYDLVGREVMRKAIYPSDKNLSFDASTISDGIYLYKFLPSRLSEQKGKIIIK